MTDLLGQRAVVVGAGIGGLSMAGALAKYFEGDWEEMPWLGGQGIGLIHDIPSATDAVERMMAEARDILGRLSGAIRR